MKKIMKRITLTLGIILAVLVSLFLIYTSDYYHASSEAQQYLTRTDHQIHVTEQNGYISFLPENPVAGFIFYPGGKVACEAYAPLLYKCAQAGILCVMPRMPLNLAVFGIDRADGIQKIYPQISKWYIGGHSLGGSMAAEYLSSHSDTFDGLILLASYSASDLHNSNISVLSVYGSEDHVLNMEKYQSNKKNLPADLTEKIIQGGIHSYFGMYGLQKGDGTPSVSNSDQLNTAAEQIASWITSHPQ